MNSRPSIFFLLSILFCINLFGQKVKETDDITIIAGAETHAMVDACDCRLDPGGGLLKRSYLINSLREKQQVIVLDAGGFSGGGIYDSYTEGRSADSQRTIQTMQGIGKIKYDAVAIGDDDLQFGANWLFENAKKYSVPLVSANCFFYGTKRAVQPYVLIKKGPYTYAITSVTSPEPLLDIDTSITIKDPVTSLRSIWKEMAHKSDFQVILSHLGLDKTNEISDSFPDCDLIVNGHRKSDSQPYTLHNGTPVMQFGFLGKKLSLANLTISGKKLNLVKGEWLTVGPDIPDDTSLIYLLKNSGNLSLDVYDLYIMSQCPYGLEALKEFTDFIQKFKKIQWNIHFIGTVENDSLLSSLHGEAEVTDEMVWLAVKELYTDRWLEFLIACSEGNTTGMSVAQKMSLDMLRISSWISTKGKKRLTAEYNRSIRLDIKGSPTLLVNNIPVENKITFGFLGKNLCEKKPHISSECDSLPQCFENSDCKQRGKIGMCVSGNCEFRDAVRFEFTVLVADSSLQHPENEVIATTEELFPGAEINKITLHSSQGQAIIKKFEPEALPFYLFGKEIKQAYNFSSIEKGLIEKKGSLTFKDGVVPANYFYKREIHNGERSLLIDPFFSKISLIFNSIFCDSLQKKNLTVLPVFYTEPDLITDDPLENFRVEEAGRWLTINKEYKNNYMQYLLAYSKKAGTSYFNRVCKFAGVNADSLSESTLKDTLILDKHWKYLKDLHIEEPVVLLINNREKVVIKSEKDLLEQFSEKR